MYGDTTVMRRRADQLREQGVDIAQTADQLVAQADGIDWTGRAAATMRARIHDRARHLREAASSHESAADSMGRHEGIDVIPFEGGKVKRKDVYSDSVSILSQLGLLG